MHFHKLFLDVPTEEPLRQSKFWPVWLFKLHIWEDANWFCGRKRAWSGDWVTKGLLSETQAVMTVPAVCSSPEYLERQGGRVGNWISPRGMESIRDDHVLLLKRTVFGLCWDSGWKETQVGWTAVCWYLQCAGLGDHIRTPGPACRLSTCPPQGSSGLHSRLSQYTCQGQMLGSSHDLQTGRCGSGAVPAIRPYSKGGP